MNLSNGEEQLMNLIWGRGSAFMKDILDDYPDPKPAPTTIATLLKRLIDKGALSYRTFGNSREYFPLVDKSNYFAKKVNELVKNFFNDSPSQFASFFTRETAMDTQQLESLKAIIEEQLKSKKP